MSKHVTLAVTGSIFIFVVALVVAACGAPPAATPSPATKAPVSPAAPKIAPTAKVDPSALRTKGEEIYKKTAGGMGCQACHGADGKGVPNTAPNILGKSADDIKRALGGDAMRFIAISDDDLQAVAAYLKSLESK